MTDAELEALVERVAEAAYMSTRNTSTPWAQLPKRMKGRWFIQARAALAVAEPALRGDERERVKSRVVDECEDLMQRTDTPIRRAREDAHLSEQCHQEGRWHAANDLREVVEKIGPDAIRARKDTP